MSLKKEYQIIDILTRQGELEFKKIEKNIGVSYEYTKRLINSLLKKRQIKIVGSGISPKYKLYPITKNKDVP